MRTALYLGTSGCRPALDDALDGYHERLVILVPADPRLLGSKLDADGLAAGLADVAAILAERALEDAVETARRQDQALAGVFDQAPRDPNQRLDTRILEGDLVGALRGVFADLPDADALFVARDTLDILDAAGIRPADALEPHRIELVAR